LEPVRLIIWLFPVAAVAAHPWSAAVVALGVS
jgi:hypothetical protein